jgi:uncharacterized membrane protein
MTLTDWAIRLSLIFFSGLGLWSCLYFAQEEFNVRKKKTQHHEFTCADGSCIMLARTPWARIFGFPNWYMGIVYYVLVILAAVISNETLVALAMLGAAFSTIMSVVLMYGLAVKLRVFCKFCYLAHFANIAILFVWTFVLYSLL